MNQAALFNFNDLTLLSIMIECTVLCIFIAFAKHKNPLQKVMLAGFILSHIFYALDILCYWNLPLNRILASYSANLFFVFGFASFIKGPLLLGYTFSLLYPEQHSRKWHLLHFSPLLLYPVVMYLGFYQYDIQTKTEWAITQTVDSHSGIYLIQYAAKNISAWIYALVSMFLVIQFKQQPSRKMEQGNLVSWLTIFNGGFLAIWSFIIYIHLDSWLIQSKWVYFFGTLGNYAHFILLNVLIVYALSKARIFLNATHTEAEKKHYFTIDNAPVPDSILNKVKHKITHEKIHLKKNITLERFAEEVGISPRKLSALLNNELQLNFFEFINQYRVEEAKRLLITEPQLTVQDVMTQAGFKSKTAFNRFFLKFTDQTPSAFRKGFLEQLTQ